MNDSKTTYSEKRPQKPYNSPFLTTNEASGFLRLKPKTLINRRALGLGPRYRKHGGRVVYHMDNLINWSRAGDRTEFPGER